MMNEKSALLSLALMVIVLAGCLSGPLPESQGPSPPPITPPQPSIDELNFIDLNSITIPELGPEIDDLAPELEGLMRIPLDSMVDVVSNDLSLLNKSNRLQILASITSRKTFLYIRPQRDTDILIYFTIYKLNDSKTAGNLLEAYKEVWNRRALNVSGGQIWIWDGYLEETAGMAPAVKKDSILYWDPQQNMGKPLTERVFPELPALSKTKNTLYSVHGETAVGSHFIMMDVKSELPDIQNKTDTIFKQAGEQLFGKTNQTPVSQQEMSNDEKAGRIKTELRVALEGYLEGNISKNEYDRRFEELNAKLKNLTESE